MVNKRVGYRGSFTSKAGICSRGVIVVLLASFVVGTGGSAAAAAEPPSPLWEVCPFGTSAAQCDFPRGVAADSDNGHVFVGDSLNQRINEFNALGQFIKTWGWDVVESGPGDDTTAPQDQFEICVPEDDDTCKEGTTGSGAGQFPEGSPQGVAVDSAGSIYVVDRGLPSNARVQKFNRAGEFVLMFGGEVNKTKVELGSASEEEENLCPFDPGDECKVGTEGIGQGQFGEWPFTGDWIDINRNGTKTDTDDSIYVGDEERIQAFDAEGIYQDECAVAGTVEGLAADTASNLYAIYGGVIHKLSPIPDCDELPVDFEVPGGARAVAVDTAGHVYAFGPTNPGNPIDPIFEFEPDGNLFVTFGKGEFNASTGIATNLCPGSEPPGNLFVTNASSENAFVRAYGTEPIGCFKARTLPASNVEETSATLNGTVNPSGSLSSECRFEYGTTTAYGTTVPCAESAAEIGAGTTPVPIHADINGLQKGTVYHFRLRARIEGETETGPDLDFKTKGPPVITEEHTASATDTEATLKAFVNPEGFATIYRFEYVDQASFEAEGFNNPQTTEETAIGEDRSEHPVSVNLEDLVPGTAYRWRVVATNSSGVSESETLTFFTYRVPVYETECSNQQFRTGASASLPDCRAYEMVSPVDKGGGDVIRELVSFADPGGYVQAASDGNRLTYTTTAAFADPPNVFRFNQYLAARQGDGWSNEGLHTPVTGRVVDESITTFGFVREFMGFSPDLCSAWLIDYQAPPPTIDGQVGFPNLYRRDNCGADVGIFEALVSSPQYEPPPGSPKGYINADAVQGYSADARHAIFAASTQLTPEAAAGSGTQLYDRFGGELHLVSVLPNGSAAPGNSEVGSGSLNNLDNAVSEDGSLAYWTGGKIYVRQHPEQGVVAGECETPEAACTLEVSDGGATFWNAAADGSKALYSEGDDLYEFNLKEAEEGEASQQIAENVSGVAGTSDDLSHIYFVSTDALPGSGQNSEGDEAVAGQPNLYLEAEGAVSFVATLVAGDVGEKEPGTTVLGYNLITQGSYERATRVSADGSRIAFQSRAPLTGYDNTGVGDGRAAVEVFTYEAGGELQCVSCNPSGARPSVRELLRPYSSSWEGLPTKVPAAAWIPTWEQPLHASNVLSADGNRLFFNSNDALLPRDANGTQDVYEWEALGTGGCDAADPNYFAQNGGCVYLISNGESPYESEFWEAGTDGRDVFFTTESSLLPQDPGLIDLYDARVGGGFPQPIPIEPCDPATCQNPPPPPADPTPASESYTGPGNPPKAKKCPKGKRKVRKKGGKTRCVKKKKHKKKGKGKAKKTRRAGR